MRGVLCWGLLCALSVAGCNQPPSSSSSSSSPPAAVVPAAAPAAPAAPPYSTSLNLKQVMEWVIDPAADVVWDSVAIIITKKGEEHRAPKTDEDWDKVRNSAATIQEAGNLLMMQSRARDDKKWMGLARRMSDAANIALKAAEKKDVAALFDSGATIYNACSACHATYRVGEEPPAVKPADEKAAK